MIEAIRAVFLFAENSDEAWLDMMLSLYIERTKSFQQVHNKVATVELRGTAESDDRWVFPFQKPISHDTVIRPIVEKRNWLQLPIQHSIQIHVYPVSCV